MRTATLPCGTVAHLVCRYEPLLLEQAPQRLHAHNEWWERLTSAHATEPELLELHRSSRVTSAQLISSTALYVPDDAAALIRGHESQCGIQTLLLKRRGPGSCTRWLQLLSENVEVLHQQRRASCFCMQNCTLL